MDSAFPPPLVPPATTTFPSAATPPPKQFQRHRRFDPAHDTTGGGNDTRERIRAELRARLLSMILENERVRRNEKRTSLS